MRSSGRLLKNGRSVGGYRERKHDLAELVYGERVVCGHERLEEKVPE